VLSTLSLSDSQIGLDIIEKHVAGRYIMTLALKRVEKWEYDPQNMTTEQHT